MRANRLGAIAPSVLIYPQTQVPAVLDALRREKPALWWSIRSKPWTCQTKTACQARWGKSANPQPP